MQSDTVGSLMLDLDTTDLIGDFATGTYTVTRRAAATWVEGILTAGATSSLTIAAAVYPATGRDLQRLPEGRRAVETFTVVTATPLLVGGQGSANEADLVTLDDGATWEVQHVSAWPSAEGYTQAIVQRPAI